MHLRTTVLFGFLSVALLADTASAGVFRRVWENRKAELHAELYCQLSAQFQSDLAREIAALDKRMQALTNARLDDEAKKLHTQMNEIVAELRKQVTDHVAAENRSGCKVRPRSRSPANRPNCKNRPPTRLPPNRNGCKCERPSK